MVLKRGFILSLVLVFLGVFPRAYGQEAAFQNQAQTQNLELKRNVARVLFSTLGGAVLGLSTLSFYGQPQEHTNNITLGALVGLVAGSGYVIYSAQSPQKPASTFESYGLLELNRKEAPAYSARAPLFIQCQFDF